METTRRVEELQGGRAPAFAPRSVVQNVDVLPVPRLQGSRMAFINGQRLDNMHPGPATDMRQLYPHGPLAVARIRSNPDVAIPQQLDGGLLMRAASNGNTPNFLMPVLAEIFDNHPRYRDSLQLREQLNDIIRAVPDRASWTPHIPNGPTRNIVMASLALVSNEFVSLATVDALLGPAEPAPAPAIGRSNQVFNQRRRAAIPDIFNSIRPREDPQQGHEYL